MSGRYEKEIQIEESIKSQLNSMPDILSEYYYSLIGSGKSYRTAKEYINHICQFVKFVFKGECSEDFYTHVKPIHINKYISSLRVNNVSGKRISDSYKTVCWSALKSFFDFLIPEYMSSNPVLSTKRPKMKDNPDVTYLTQEEIIQVLDNVVKRAIPRMLNRDLCILKLGFATGLRVSAIVQIDIDDLDLKNNRIKVTEKGDRDYYVIIGENLKSQIKLWLKDREMFFAKAESNALFVSQEYHRISTRTINDLLKKYTDIIDKRVTPHVMRHSCATNLYEATGDIYLCASQLHHKNVATTQRYAEISSEKKKHAADILDKQFDY